jgi:hypothetical protein
VFVHVRDPLTPALISGIAAFWPKVSNTPKLPEPRKKTESVSILRTPKAFLLALCSSFFIEKKEPVLICEIFAKPGRETFLKQ